MKNKVSWNLFNKWYRDTRHRIVPVDVEGRPMEEEILKKIQKRWNPHLRVPNQ